MERNRLTTKLSRRQIILGFFFLLPCYLFVVPYLVRFSILYYCSLFSIVPNVYYNIVLNVVSTIICLLLVYYVLKDYIYQNIISFKERWLSHVIWTFSIGVILFYTLSIISNMILRFFLPDPNIMSSNQQLINQMLSSETIFMLILTVILAPVLEELLFRGIIFTSLYEKNPWLAHFVSAFLFGFLHVYSAVFSGNLTQLLYVITYGSMGLAFSIAYEKRDTICVPILLHMTNNLIAVMINIMMIRFG